MFDKGYFFFFGTLHRYNLLILVELHLVDVLEHFFEVRLHCERFFGLRQDLEQICVGEEVETCEFLSFFLKVTAKFFLDGLQVLIGFLQSLEESVL